MSQARFTVVGAGAIGLLFAAKLGLSGQPVELCVRREAHRQALLTDGIRLQSGISGQPMREGEGTTSVQAVEARFFPEARLLQHPLQSEERGGLHHYILLAVKQSAISSELVRQVYGLMGPDSWVVCLQNGIGHIETLRSLIPGERIVAAVTTEGAMRSSDTATVHTGQGETWLGSVQAKQTKAAAEAQKKLSMLLNQAGFRTFPSKNITSRVWQKLIINSVINPITAILQVTNGELPKQPQALELMQALYDEAASLAAELKLTLAPDLWDQLLEVCRKTAANRSSMLQDISSGRTTEIDSITGGLLREAEKLRMPLPTHQTVYRLIKAMEGRECGRGRM